MGRMDVVGLILGRELLREVHVIGVVVTAGVKLTHYGRTEPPTCM